MVSRAAPAVDEPRFSMVTAVYDVAPYLEDFIASIEAQTHPSSDLEVIVVDDGSTDGSLDVLKAWQTRRPDLVTVLTKPNGGQASARNLGLDHARGQWVTFTDPDDMLRPDALAEVAAFLDKHPKTQLVAMRRVLLYDRTGTEAPHPLDSHFRVNRLRNLDEQPDLFYGSAPCAFFRTSEIERLGLRFHEDIRPSFEDGYFCDEYLLRVPAPWVAFVRSAEYVYRKRADSSSTLNRAKVDVARYTTLLELGYLGILRESVRLRGSVPDWLQSHILYELSWLFGEEERATSPVMVPVVDRVHELLGQIAGLLDESNVNSFSLRRFQPVWREILLHGFRDAPWHTPFAIVDRADMRQKMLRVSYRFIGELPDEQLLVDGRPVEPRHAKIRSQKYFQRTIVRWRIAWVPYGTVQVRLNGSPVALVVEEPDPPRSRLEGWRARNVHSAEHRVQRAEVERAKARSSLADRAVVRLARTRLVRRYFGEAWVLVDRLHDADDSAEHLFRHLRRRHRRINAWFVLERGGRHRTQLRKDGFKRVISPGTLLWKLLMLNCDQLISSHADYPITRPAAVVRLAVPRWRFVFLQHGVTKDDLSEWLNVKQMDVFVVSTPAEYRSIVDDDTAYDYTTREAKLTGLPRFDRVLEAGRRYPPADRDLILIAPTWRQWLGVRTDRTNQRWSVDPGEFTRSEFARNWLAVIRSTELRALAANEGLTIGLLLHPNLQSIVPHLELPSGIELFDFESDVRTVFARARAMVTDYSSMAFNAAYIDRPVVYFQFDRGQVLNGQHVGRRGYFDYETDGFGPVTETPDAAVRAVVEQVSAGPAPSPEYQRRIDETFPLRDGGCCERVTVAISESVRPVRRGDAR